jgi:aryl-alcohol dehydrogenase-like predicted oxidoreductase
MAVPRTTLAPGYSISRLIKGGWQLAGGHGAVDGAAARRDMHAFVEAGITTFDCADIYTGVESLIGDFVRERGGAGGLQIHTKYVPDRSALPGLTPGATARAIDRSLQRLRADTLDLVQLHWWDYAVPGAVEALHTLDALRRAGKVRHLGVTNFDTPVLATLLDAGLPIVTHQVQYSVLDQRPSGAMQTLCARHGVRFLCYGALAGGFLSERYLDAPPPDEPLANRSLTKYRLVIEEFGGWDRFQELLGVLAKVAARRGAGIGAVAVAWVLEQPSVGGVIVGARHTGHLGAALVAGTLALTDADRLAIGEVIEAGPTIAGDVYALERTPGGRHAAIMRYDLNAGADTQGSETGDSGPRGIE